MLKTALKGIGYTILVIFCLLVLYVILFTIGSNGKCIACSTQTVTDTVVDIYEGGPHDVVFALKSHKSYYINRGMENGLDIAALKTQMLNKQVTISYASPTTHINQCEFEGKIIYSQLKD